MVPMAGVEPARGCPHKILSLARLPIPSHRLIQLSYYYNTQKILFFKNFLKLYNLSLFIQPENTKIPKNRR